MTDGPTPLANDELEMVTVLRINRKFMEYMKVQSMRTRTHARTHSITHILNQRARTHALTHSHTHTHTQAKYMWVIGASDPAGGGSVARARCFDW